MVLANTITASQPDGIPGELAFEGPRRAAPYILQSTDAANNVMGRAFTTVSEGIAQAGGTGAFAGLLCDPKTQTSFGGVGGSLAPATAVPNGKEAECLTMGILYVTLPAAAAIGDLVTYNTTTGALATIAPAGTPAAGTALVPNCKVSHRTVTAAGLAIVTITN